MKADDVETLYELSPLQQGILLHTLAAPKSGTYFEQISWTVRGRFDTAAFTAAWQRIVDRHPVLRTSFHSEGLDKPLQIVHRQATLPVDEQDWRGVLPDDREATLQAYLSADRRRGFDLAEAPLLRLGIARLADEAWQVTLGFHHLLLDGWSVALAVRDVFLCYEAIARGQEPQLGEVRPFQDYIAWLQRQDMSEAEAFWRAALRGLTAPTALAIQQATPALPSQAEDYGARQEYLSAASTDALQQFARRQRVTLNTVVQGAWALLLSRYSGDRDVLFGAVTSGRPMDLDGASAMVGLFINTIPMRAPVPPDDTVGPWLKRLQDLQVRMRQYEYAPLVEIHGWSGIPRAQPLFTSILAFENYPADRNGTSADADVQVSDLRIFEKTNFPLSAAVKPGERLSLRLLYDLRQFDEASIARMLGHFRTLLEEIAANPARRLADVPMLTAGERRQLLQEWNATDAPCPMGTPVQSLVARQAAARPAALAGDAGGDSLTYQDLNGRASQLARALRAAGVGPERVVAVFMDRSPSMLVALLGILKAGGAYLPIDPSCPPDRLTFMLADAQAPIVITEARLRSRLPQDAGRRVLSLDADWDAIGAESTAELPVTVPADGLAYVIYTSGSTGRPKGVQITHGGLLNLVHWHQRRYAITADDRATQIANVAFDASVWEIWPYLTAGACICFPDARTAGEPAALWRWLADNRIAVTFLPTPLAEAMLREPLPDGLALRALLTGGDRLTRGLSAPLPFELVNHYGPTENSVVATCATVEPASARDVPPPIGRPIDNVRAYVLDDSGQPVPVGVPGELYLAGGSLARGYLRRPDLTAERFVPNPFGGSSDSRLYRTGDLVRYLPDGNLQFLGRNDHQVKVRGYRLELGEIDAAIGAHPLVGQCVTVVVDDAGQKRLVSYVVPAAAGELSWDDVRASVRDRLPEYMIPSQFVLLDAMPLNANGKVDRGALPAVTAERQVERQYVAPRGEMERRIAGIWREVLGLDAVGVRDNFFELGGHSLLLVQLHGKLVEALGLSIPLVELFEFPTVEALARRLGGTIEDLDTRPAGARAQRALRTADPGDAIAVVGMAGRFPGSPDLEQFWTNLRQGVESIRFFTDEEMKRAGVDGRLLRDPRFVKARAVLEGADLFDAAFFGYNPREADLIDPQQRVFLECASSALEHAGYDPDRYDGLVGVYAGSSLNTYLLNVLAHPSVAPSLGGLQALIASGTDFLPTRVSYKLNLRGPSVNIQTACSTSLVAVHQACRSLLDNECDLALAGGVSVSAPLVRGHLYQDGGITSPDGHCRAFDAEARGTVGGNGVGVVVLKRLSEALRDGDTIHAVIRGTAINNDGSGKVGYTAPGLEGQSEVIALAQASAGVAPDSISYIEAHGTGTALGDPIEVAALRRVFDGRTGAGSCAIGSVKTNIGHLDAAAGVAGLIKTILALQHGELPPSLHFVRPNPEIAFDGSPFYVNARLSPWRTAGTRRAGVSSFGIGGTNAHAILEQAPDPRPAEPSRPWQLLVLSARTPTALEAVTSQLADRLRTMPAETLADVAYTLQVGRRIFSHRRVLACRTPGEAAAALARPARAPVETGFAEAGERPLVFMFSGQGSQYAGMAAELYRDEPSFREDVDACCDALQRAGAVDLRAALFAREGAADGDALKQTAVTQPALFVIEYALARLWQRWGVQPSALIGHSIGEYVAACLAGVFTRDDALRLVAERGRLMQAMPAGSMLAVPMSEAELMPLLSEAISIAAVNGPSLCVASGPEDAIAALGAKLASRSVAVRRLETSHAFHSAMMDPVLAAFEAEVARVPRQAPRIPFVSNVTGTWITADEATSPAYWARHLRAPVRFGAGVQTLLADAPRVLLEVGPGRTLASLAQQARPGAQTKVCTSLRHAQETTADLAALLRTLGRLWLGGVTIDWAGYYGAERRRRVPLPTYPFERQRHWIDVAVQPEAPAPSPARAPLVKTPDIASWFYVPTWTRTAQLRPDAGAVLEGTSVIFAEEAGPGLRLAERLRSERTSFVIVRAAERFTQIDEATYALNPGRPADYDALVEALVAQGRQPRRIAHLWSLAPLPSTGDPFEAAQAAGFYSVLFLVQALARRGAVDPLDLFLVSDRLHAIDAADVVSPEKSTILGLSLVIPQEYASVRCACIDVPLSGAPEVDTVADRLYSELAAGPEARVVAYRGTERWEQTYAPGPLAATADGVPLREGGVYLITGGLGRVGLACAERLARVPRVRLVLVGQTPLPASSEWTGRIASDDLVARRIRAVRDLEARGAEVMVAAADVADFDQMTAVVASARDRFGEVHGIIHAAGSARGAGLAPIQTIGRAECEIQFRGKARGLYVLERLAAGLELDFCLLTSSLASVLGGLTFSAYAAANQFLDSFVDRQRQSGDRRWISVNLDGWLFEQAGRTATSDLGMTPAEGVESLLRVIGSPGLSRVVVSTADLEARLNRYVRKAPATAAIVSSPAAALSRHARPDVAAAYAAPIDEIEAAIADVWQELLGIEKIGRDDNFFDLGGHSLLLVQAHAQLTETLARDVPVTDLFRFPTIATLAQHLGGTRRAQPAAPVRADDRSREGSNAIAIVGMACRFPGAPDLETFWANLREGVESIERITDEELRQAGVDETLLRHPAYVKAASAIEGTDLFDAAFFGYSPREAAVIDPQHRVFLECAWEALERAGLDPQRYPGLVGVYAGAASNGYLANVLSNPDIVQSIGSLQASLGSKSDFLPTRVSYKLNLRGPSLNVQTACSTSLVAVHQACRSLIDGECDVALAGGVAISVPARTGYFYIEEGILSPDGHCRAFDANAQGTVPGNGVGVVVLKRLAEALADGDVIHAVIRGTAINNDGSVKVGYTAPGIDGQATVISRAHAVAGVEPSAISYIEAHGTGTALGDPIEVAALTQAFGPAAAGSCAIGTLKTNIGHLDAAAGVAGLIKTALALEHGQLPPSLHFETPNPKIDFPATPFVVNTRLTPWKADGRPRMAGVSSFGIGGTNAHAVLEEPPARAGAGPSREWQVLPLSARSAEALEAAGARLASHLERHGDLNLADVAYTLQVGRHEFTRRRAVICRTSDEAAAILRGKSGRPCVGEAMGAPGSVAFMFPGQGASPGATGEGLYRQEPIFRAVVDGCAERLTAHLQVDLRRILYPLESEQAFASEALTRTPVARAALFVVESALAALWRAWGIEPAACFGHGIGEYVAACVSGVLSLEDALTLVAARDDDSFSDALKRVELTSPAIPLISNVTGTWIRPAEATDPEYWARQRREAASPGDGVRELLTDPRRVLLEVGPGRSLGMLATQHAQGGPDRVVLSSLRHEDGLESDGAAMMSALGQLWISGLPVDWGRLHEGERRLRVALPTYPFERKRYWIEPARGAAAHATVAPAGRSELSDWFHIPSWKRSMAHAPGADGEARPPSRWMLFADAAGVAAGVERQLRHTGHDVVVVDEADRFRDAGGGRFALDPGNADHYKSLFSALDQARWMPDVIGHFWGVDAASEPADSGACQDRGFYSLIHLAQALGETGSSAPVRLGIVTSDLHEVTGAETLNPSKATMLGPCRVIPAEYPHVTCRAIDLVTSEYAGGDERGIAALIRDLAGGTGEPVVAYRRGHRWVESVEPVRLDEPRGGEPSRLRERGVYLITGGLGGIGLTLAEYLARTMKARLVLTSRTGLPDRDAWAAHVLDRGNEDRVSRQIQAVEALERAGAEVIVLPADVSRVEDMRRTVEQARARFGRIDGVIHAAGIAGGGVIQLKSRAAADAVLAPKLTGTQALAQALDGVELDFLALCSSAASLLGGGGQVDYCAANAYLDAFARYHTWRTGTFTISINWDAWQQVGMAVETDVPDHVARYRAELLKRAIAPSEGVEAFRRILAWNTLPQIVVSTLPWSSRLKPAARADAPPAPAAPADAAASGTDHTRPSLSTDYVQPTDDLERAIVETWQQLLGIDRIGVNDDFFELGGHSLLATQLTSRMRQRFDIDLSLAEVFEAPTVAGLADLILAKLLDEEEPTVGV